MKKWIFLSAGLVAGLIISLSPRPVEAKGYGVAGCGLGSIVIGSKPGFMQVSAATTNGTFYSQLIGIVLGMSNCTENGVIKAELEQRAFLAMNFEAIQQEAAKGEGESLNSLAFLMGCDAGVMPAFGAQVQNNSEKIFASSTSEEADFVLYRIKESVKENDMLAKGCQKVWM